MKGNIDLEIRKGFFQNVDCSSKVPEGITSEVVYTFIYGKDGKVQTVPGGGGSVGIMHELFHVVFEGNNQRKINRYDNKVRRILAIPERSVDDPKHNYN